MDENEEQIETEEGNDTGYVQVSMGTHIEQPPGTVIQEQSFTRFRSGNLRLHAEHINHIHHRVLETYNAGLDTYTRTQYSKGNGYMFWDVPFDLEINYERPIELLFTAHNRSWIEDDFENPVAGAIALNPDAFLRFEWVVPPVDIFDEETWPGWVHAHPGDMDHYAVAFDLPFQQLIDDEGEVYPGVDLPFEIDLPDAHQFVIPGQRVMMRVSVHPDWWEDINFERHGEGSYRNNTVLDAGIQDNHEEFIEDEFGGFWQYTFDPTIAPRLRVRVGLDEVVILPPHPRHVAKRRREQYRRPSHVLRMRRPA